MAKFEKGKDFTVDEMLKEIGMDNLSYDGEELDEDPDKDFYDPYEKTLERILNEAENRE